MPRSPAENLEGLTLDGGWTVGSLVPKSSGATGGAFSESYTVHKPTGEKAFLKALDVSGVMMSPDFTTALEAKLRDYNFERELLEQCRRSGFDRIVVSIAHGVVPIIPPDPNSPPDPNNPLKGLIPVPYLIFELAEGDIRQRIDLTATLDLTWTLRTIHQFTVGVGQLHGAQISHQDLKPSNIFDFGHEGSKVGDLGRAVTAGGTLPHEQFAIAGAISYAPPELLYGYTAADWSKHRFGCDLYQLGSLITFMFCKVTLNGILSTHLPTSHLPGVWIGTYTDILPQMRDAFDHAMDDLASNVPEPIRDELVTTVRYLSEPDPELRGHPLNRDGLGSSYSLERFISRFDLLATRALLIH